MSNTNCNFVAGQWVVGDHDIENRNPSDTSDLIGRYAQASRDQLDQTLAKAKSAQAAWVAYGMERKQAVLMSIGQEMMARADELGQLLSREEGKPLAEGRGEVFRAGQFFTYYAAECLRQLGENADSVRDGVEIDVRREPVGVVAIVSPNSAPMKRLKDEAKEERRLIDATFGRRTRSIIIMDSNHIVLSAIQSETISQRFIAAVREARDHQKREPQNNEQ